MRVRWEVQRGIQTIQYQIQTLLTTNGQTPFVSVFMYLDAFSKLSFEAEFQALSPGGAISYVEVPNMQNNIPAVLAVIALTTIRISGPPWRKRIWWIPVVRKQEEKKHR